MLAERMGPLPEGWSIGRIGDFATESKQRAGYGADLPVLSVSKHHGIVRSDQYFSKRVYGKDTSHYKVVQPGQFAYATIHLNEGSIGRLKESTPGLVSPMYTVFDVRNGIDPDYLFAVLKSERSLKVYETITQGTVKRRGGISFSTLSGLLLAHPPLREQRKIAAILSSVDDAIEKTQAVIDQVQLVKRGLMQELLTRGLPGRHTRFKQTEIGEIPEEWLVATIGDLARLSGGHGFRPPEWSNSGLPIIRIQNLNRSTNFNYFAGITDNDWVVEPGELLFAWAGSRGASFGPRIWPGPRGVLNQHIYRVKPTKDVELRFLFHLRSQITTGVERKAHGFKHTLVHLRKSELTNWKIGLPSPEEQQHISRVIDAVESRATREAEGLQGLSRARSTLMSILLTGELRVAPDPEAA